MRDCDDRRVRWPVLCRKFDSELTAVCAGRFFVENSTAISIDIARCTLAMLVLTYLLRYIKYIYIIGRLCKPHDCKLSQSDFIFYELSPIYIASNSIRMITTPSSSAARSELYSVSNLSVACLVPFCPRHPRIHRVLSARIVSPWL